MAVVENMTLDLSRCRVPPPGVPPYPLAHFSHQVAGIEALVKDEDHATGRVIPGCFLLADETGAGKTKQAIDAAQVLFVQGRIKRAIVVAPGAVRTVWADPELGELAKHMWLDLPSIVTEYHSRTKAWVWATEGSNAPRMEWYVTNYEFIKSAPRLAELLKVVDRRTVLVLDESAYIKNGQAARTKAVRELRKRAGRVWLMNGTPIADKPFDLFAQANMMDPAIISCSSMTKFQARYCVMGGYMAKTPWGEMPTQVLRWQHLDDLQRRMAPYVLRRMKVDCIDLPPKLEPIVRPVALTPATWAHYRAMRDDMVAWLTDTNVSTAQQAITKVMRLSQITSGFIGGVEQMEELADTFDWGMDDDGKRISEDRGDDGAGEGREADHTFAGGDSRQAEGHRQSPAPSPVVEIGREKLDDFLEWLAPMLDGDPTLKLLVMCRFRPEANRVADTLRQLYSGMDVGMIVGGQKKDARREALRLMDPRTTPSDRPSTVVMTSAGNVGLTLTAAHTVFRMSRDTSLYKWLQGDDRTHRPTQVHPVSFWDQVAEGPKGQKTIDRHIYLALRAKFDVAAWTTSAWVSKVGEE